MAVISRLWWQRGYPAEGRGWLEQALARDARTGRAVRRARSAARAAALTGAGTLALWQGDLGAARAFYEASLAIHRERVNKPGILLRPIEEPSADSPTLRDRDHVTLVSSTGQVAWPTT